jgi:ASC-1-like (ASCH) protein
MIIDINVQEPYVSFILNGTKTVEGRLNKGKFLNIKITDTLRINNNEEFIVVAKNIYSSFKDMIASEGLKNVIPDVASIDEAVAVYYKFYTKEDEQKYGVIGIKIIKK